MSEKEKYDGGELGRRIAALVKSQADLQLEKAESELKNMVDLLKRFGWDPDKSTLEVWLETNMLLIRQAREHYRRCKDQC